MISRRSLNMAAFLSTTALAGCNAFSWSQTGDVTTITLQVAQLNAWGQAIINAATFIAGLPGLAGTAAGLAIGAMAGAARAALAAAVADAGPTQVFTFDSSSVPASISSLLADGQTVLADARAGLGSVATQAVAMANEYVDAISTIVSLFTAAIGSTSALAAEPPKMPESQALAVLKVSHK